MGTPCVPGTQRDGEGFWRWVGAGGQLGTLSKDPHARAPGEANLTPGAARGCQAGLRCCPGLPLDPPCPG